MKYNPEKHNRRSIRLQGYDYTSSGAYFITICTHQRQCLFGDVVDGIMQLNALGQMVNACWQRLPLHFSHLTLDVFVVMPNHIHGILILMDSRRGEAFGANGVGRCENPCPNASPLPCGINRVAPSENPCPDASPRSFGISGGEAFGADGVDRCEHQCPNASPLPPLPSRPRGTTPGSVGAIVQNFKSISAQQINRRCRPNTSKIWQRDYYEHIIRSEAALHRIRHYIQHNPLAWQQDSLHPDSSVKR